MRGDDLRGQAFGGAERRRIREERPSSPVRALWTWPLAILLGAALWTAFPLPAWMGPAGLRVIALEWVAEDAVPVLPLQQRIALSRGRTMGSLSSSEAERLVSSVRSFHMLSHLLMESRPAPSGLEDEIIGHRLDAVQQTLSQAVSGLVQIAPAFGVHPPSLSNSAEMARSPYDAAISRHAALGREMLRRASGAPVFQMPVQEGAAGAATWPARILLGAFVEQRLDSPQSLGFSVDAAAIYGHPSSEGRLLPHAEMMPIIVERAARVAESAGRRVAALEAHAPSPSDRRFHAEMLDQARRTRLGAEGAADVARARETVLRTAFDARTADRLLAVSRMRDLLEEIRSLHQASLGAREIAHRGPRREASAAYAESMDRLFRLSYEFRFAMWRFHRDGYEPSGGIPASFDAFLGDLPSSSGSSRTVAALSARVGVQEVDRLISETFNSLRFAGAPLPSYAGRLGVR